MNKEFYSTLFVSGEQEQDNDSLHINIRDDIQLSDQQLIEIPTKKLNKLLKDKGVSKRRSKIIKQERRTLKNRGYAAHCRVKREDEESMLEDEIKQMDSKSANIETNIRHMYISFMAPEFGGMSAQEIRKIKFATNDEGRGHSYENEVQFGVMRIEPNPESGECSQLRG